MNGHVRYTYNADTTAILFVAPTVRVRSQKTYSVNHQHISLIDNLFAFCSENIIMVITEGDVACDNNSNGDMK